jgi:hypothetical protein
MCKTSGKCVSALGLWLTLSVVSGCADGPFPELAAWNPYYRQQWQQDEQRGPTFHRRMAELQDLQRRATSLGAAEQERFIGQLTDIVRNDPQPVLRIEAIKTLAKFPSPSILPGIRLATTDEDAKVRIAACKAWGRHGGPEALQTLAEVVRRDGDLDARIAATTELGRFREPAAIEALGVALSENDAALQYQAVQSLKSSTGLDYGDSVPAWRDYLAGRTPTPEPPPSLVQRFLRLL